MKKINALLFDLDGTLLDTAPDLLFALNELRKDYGLSPSLSIADIKPIMTLGSKSMIKHALGIEEHDSSYETIREKFLSFYQEHIADFTQFYLGMDKVLTYLDNNHLPWGIVTNKLTHHTNALLRALKLDHRPGCVICGDSLSTYKPHPAPVLEACRLLQKTPQECLFVGDSLVDITAGKAAGTQSLVALYGYIGDHEDPYAWEADGYIHKPLDIIKWIQELELSE